MDCVLWGVRGWAVCLAAFGMKLMYFMGVWVLWAWALVIGVLGFFCRFGGLLRLWFLVFGLVGIGLWFCLLGGCLGGEWGWRLPGRRTRRGFADFGLGFLVLGIFPVRFLLARFLFGFLCIALRWGRWLACWLR